MCATSLSAYALVEFTSVQTKNWDRLLRAVVDRPEGTPLITISNHRSCVDDPLVWGEWVCVSVCECLGYCCVCVCVRACEVGEVYM